MLHRYAREQEESGTPFFLALHYFGPHLPYVVPDEYFDLFEEAAIQPLEPRGDTSGVQIGAKPQQTIKYCYPLG